VCLTIRNKPYFKVFGGDVRAGYQLRTVGVCTPPATQENIDANAYDVANGAQTRGGSSIEFAAQATGVMQGVYSDSQRLDVPAGRRLFFANTGIGAVRGGLFTGDTSCMRDYYALNTQLSLRNLLTSPQSIGNLERGINYMYRGTLRLGGSSGLPAAGSGNSIVIFVDGDVDITGNISFLGTYANAQQIPFVAVIASGSIRVAPGVTRLDGFYAANGVFSSCIGGPSRSCDAKLTLFGAVQAGSLRLYRSNGALRESLARPPEDQNDPSIAEVFVHVPELFINAPFDRNTSLPIYDSIITLPPIL
jgi:hypothetical protein